VSFLLDRHKVEKKVLEIVAKSNPDTILDIATTGDLAINDSD
jgi:hypothetical protein